MKRLSVVLLALLTATALTACGQEAESTAKTQSIDSWDEQKLTMFEVYVSSYKLSSSPDDYGELLDRIDGVIEILRRTPDAEDDDGASVRERMADSAATLQSSDEAGSELGRRIEIALNALPN